MPAVTLSLFWRNNTLALKQAFLKNVYIIKCIFPPVL